MAKSLKERICEGLEDREGLIVPVIRHLMAEAWEEAVAESESCGWVHDYAAQDLRGRNPYREARP